MTYFQRNIAELSHFMEMLEGVVEVFPGLASLKDVGSIGLIFCFRCPVSRSLLFGLGLLLRHHVPRCHRRLQAATPTKTEFRCDVKSFGKIFFSIKNKNKNPESILSRKKKTQTVDTKIQNLCNTKFSGSRDRN